MPFLPLHSPPRRDLLHLVVTIGPASEALIPDLATSGATAFRLNASHLDSAGLDSALTRVLECCPEAPIVVDLQGAKMRLDLRAPLDVRAEQVIRFSLSDDGDVRVPHAELFSQAGIGDTLSLDDGRVRFDVLRVRPDALEARALNVGRLLPRKGINVEQHPVLLQGLTERDLAACRVAARHGVSTVACSFMTDGREAAWLRAALPGCHVIGKVERLEAVTHLADLAARVDAVWICRGDLGAQLGLPALARSVAALEPTRYAVPVLMAGQVLEHLTDHPDATRSEVCHLFDLVVRGFAGIVLSDETAIGRDPVHAVSTAARLLASFCS
jgi:pyruvate kinase